MCRMFWCCFVGAVLHGSLLFAAAPKAGDTVHVRWAGSAVAAEVVSVNPRNGWVTVKFQQGGVAIMPTLPPDKIFANKTALAEKVSNDEEKLLDLLRTNSDGKNVSTDDLYAWHAPGRNGQKQGPLLVTARVKAYRKGSQWMILEEPQGEKTKEHLLKIDQISNENRKYLFGLIRKKPLK